MSAKSSGHNQAPKESVAAEAPPDAAAAAAKAGYPDLAERFWSRLRLFSLRRLGDPADAEDVAQETLRRVLDALRDGRVRKPEALPAFVFQTARNVCLQRGRSSRRETRALSRLKHSDQPGSREHDALTALVSAERRRAVRRAVEQLSDTDRQLLRLIFYEDTATEEVARRLGISSGAVRVRKHRALRRVSELLEHEAEAADYDAGGVNGG